MIASDEIELTQEFLSHMLGVQRTSVSLSAHELQKSGLIKYSRGKIRLLTVAASNNVRVNVTRPSVDASTTPFLRGFDTLDLKEAKALLGELAG